MLSGSLELASKQVVSGAVRTCFAVIYSLFLVSRHAHAMIFQETYGSVCRDSE